MHDNCHVWQPFKPSVSMDPRQWPCPWNVLWRIFDGGRRGMVTIADDGSYRNCIHISGLRWGLHLKPLYVVFGLARYLGASGVLHTLPPIPDILTQICVRTSVSLVICGALMSGLAPTWTRLYYLKNFSETISFKALAWRSRSSSLVFARIHIKFWYCWVRREGKSERGTFVVLLKIFC